MSDAIITAAIEKALSVRYAAPEFAYLTQVRNGTGYVRTQRTADALALGLWPSRGIHLHGFEIKASRGDLKRELQKPDKAEPIAQFCNYWWIAAPEGMAEVADLPANWGLLELRNGKMRVAKAAEFRAAEPLTIEMIAGIMRNVSERMVPKSIVDVQVKERVEAEIKHVVDYQRREDKMRLERADRLRERVTAFEEASGVRITSYQSGDIGTAVRLVLSGKLTLSSQKDTLEWIHKRIKGLDEELSGLMEELPAVMASIDQGNVA